MSEKSVGIDIPLQESRDSETATATTEEETKMIQETDELYKADEDEKHKDLSLYEEEDETRPFVSRVISRLANYEGGIVPNIEQHRKEELNAAGTEMKVVRKAEAPRKLGTILGVYFPCIQNIFGVILFIRMVWVVGTAGWLQAFVIVFMCCCCTLTTSISMSAIATNGVVSGGGSYFMISRALGPEFGGAVGLLFYLGTTVASSMYIVGAVEILLQYMAPAMSLFGPINIPANAYNNYRVYGTCLLLLMFICVFIGVKFVSKFSPVALFCVLGTILCVYIGIFLSKPDRGPRICFLGDRLIASDYIYNSSNGEMECHKDRDGPLYQLYCGNVTEDDEDCDYFKESETQIKPGIPGLGSGVFRENAFSRFNNKGERVGHHEAGNRAKADVVTDITTTFVILVGIFFPSVTGIMAGSNRSGDLADPQKSIPIGTIGAVLTTSAVYLSCLLFFASCVEGQLLQDKFGESIGGGLIVANIAWPHPWVVMLGAFLSTCGAGLQSLVGAPRLLQAIASDGIIPFLNPFAVTNKKGEPIRSLLLTTAIAEAGILLANVDYIAPIITMFFLMCYCFTNMACAVQTILKSPNWRPRFRLYHWTLSTFGVCLCLSLMFMASWYYAIAALVLAASIYKYIEYKGAEKEWGDGIRGLAMSAARFALIHLEENRPHVKNWRPQLLVLLELNQKLEPKQRNMLMFASQLKAGRGLTLIASVLEGDHGERIHDVYKAKKNVTEIIKRERIKGFADVIVSKRAVDGLSCIVQGAGVGGLKHNAVLMGWPSHWRTDPDAYQQFLDLMKIINERTYATLVLKGLEMFPDNNERVSGYIDIWWIVHDGGLLMLLPFLLTQGKVWRRCKLRIFTVAQMEDNSIQMKKDLQKFVYQLRISAEIEVIEMSNTDISAYIYERTLLAQQRISILEQLRITEETSMVIPQLVMDQAHPPTTGESSVPEEPVSPYLTEKEVITTENGADSKKSTNIVRPMTSKKNASEKYSKRAMHTAKKLNQVIRERSGDARLIILNLPIPSKDPAVEKNCYMEFLDRLTEGLKRVLMVRGSGKEVITIYS